MDLFFILMVGAVAGGLVVQFLNRPSGSKGARKKRKKGLIEQQARKKQEHKKRIRDALQIKSALTNNHLEQLVGISDATATRYGDELEKEGYVRQVGKTGRHVYYQKTK